jgi:hypothetical protein
MSDLRLSSRPIKDLMGISLSMSCEHEYEIEVMYEKCMHESCHIRGCHVRKHAHVQRPRRETRNTM